MQTHPRDMAPSTIGQRRAFYRSEFEIRALQDWIGARSSKLKFAMIPGRITGIVLPKYVANKDDVMIIDSWRTAADLRKYARRYLPEGVYYDRNRYVNVAKCRRCGRSPVSCPDCYNFEGQQLAFDLDPENVDCPYHGHLGQKLDRGLHLSFCMFEFKSVRRQALELSGELARTYENVQVVFSGRGFHVIVDDERAYHLTRKERHEMARELGKRFDIDEWVTEGGSRLLRLPYSLNALVSRKCMRIKDERVLKRFDPRTSKLVLPGFLKSA